MGLTVGGGCDKKAEPASEAPTKAAPTAGLLGGSTTSEAPPAQGVAPPLPETAPVSLDDKRRDRRGIEIDSSAPTKNLFAGAPKPPPLAAVAEGSGAKTQPKPVALADGETAPSKAGLLAAHLKSVRKLRAGILPEATSVTVFDAGQSRATFSRDALINGPGRWVSAMVVGADIPKMEAIAIDQGLGSVRLSPASRLYYEYRDGRWRWTQLWRDPR